VSNGSINFGDIQSSAAIDQLGEGSFEVECGTPTNLTISLGMGDNAAGQATRRMKNGGTFLAYMLFSDTGRANTWGDGLNFGSVHSLNNVQAATEVDVYGSILANQPAPAGTYIDSVTITISPS
jgi:spore coat protein U-like protein